MEEKMGEIRPRLKLIAKREFDIVKSKYGFKNKIKQKEIEEQISRAEDLDVLALTVAPGSGLKILNVKILNEKNEAIFTELLKIGVSE